MSYSEEFPEEPPLKIYYKTPLYTYKDKNNSEELLDYKPSPDKLNKLPPLLLPLPEDLEDLEDLSLLMKLLNIIPKKIVGVFYTTRFMM